MAFRTLAAALAFTGALASKDGPGDGVSKTTYAATDPITGKEFLMKYFPVSNADDSCDNDICVCTADNGEEWDIQQGRVALDTSSSLGSGVSPGFGLHMVNLTNRETTGGLDIASVEQIFTDKFGDWSTYDAFMDYNVGLYTTDLDQYITQFDADSVNYLTSTWTDSDSGEDWTSIMFQVPGTMMVVELFATSSSYGLQRRMANTTHTETRLGSKQAAAILAHVGSSASSDLLYATRVSRGTASMDKVDAFYTDVMEATLDIDSEDEGYTRHCYKYSTSSSVDLCFTARDESATSSDFSIGDMEDQMNAVHSNLLQKPTCGTDKYLDCHHAYDSMQQSTSTIVSYLDSAAGADTYYYCEPSSAPPPPGASGFPSTSYTLHYIIDPTGWGIQLDLMSSGTPSGCSSSARQLPGGTFNPACDLGSC